jgi:hypothetical protein
VSLPWQRLVGRALRRPQSPNPVEPALAYNLLILFPLDAPGRCFLSAMRQIVTQSGGRTKPF